MVKREGLPLVGELLICTANRLTENAAWCKLEEYPSSEGMIHVSESAGRWVYNIKDAVKVGKQYVAKVMRVDRQSGHIELSLKRVSRYDEKAKLTQFRKEQGAENILKQIAKLLKANLDEAYEKVGFPLQEEFGELSTAFEDIKDNPAALDKMGIEIKWKDATISVVNKIFVGKKVVLKVQLEIKSYNPEGINLIKELLTVLEGKGFIVKYISAPNYTVEVITDDPKKKEREMVSELEGLVSKIESGSGEASYKLVK